MQNLVSKFTPAVEATSDEGLVTIEWVALAAAAVLLAGAVSASGVLTAITTKITGLV
jgi:hypothetical protein